ncbi:MBL fold metallo-hydrolase [Aurantivibrio plasticivorans]
MADLHTSVVEKTITVGSAIQVSPKVRRITAPNAGPMTGPGTNTFLIGDDDVTVLDPGPAIDSHIDAIIEACGGKLNKVVVTHTHADHSPAAKLLKEKTGAQLFGSLLADDAHQDKSFVPDVTLTHLQQIPSDEYQLSALHTPGHVGNHFCFYLADDRMVFTGDHIMQGATVVIIPPSGDMADYIASLKLLLEYDIELLAPAHGHLMASAHEVVQQIIDHRLSREVKVITGLKRSPDSSLDTLMREVYADVDERLYRIAKLSLWAHLLKLEKEGRARKHAEQHWLYDDELWLYTGD